jgi:hypothetical protein
MEKDNQEESLGDQKKKFKKLKSQEDMKLNLEELGINPVKKKKKKSS